MGWRFSIHYKGDTSLMVVVMKDVNIYFFGYSKTAQITCLSLISEKIAVSQSTSEDMPGIGLLILIN